jgi:hypothetical protein
MSYNILLINRFRILNINQYAKFALYARIVWLHAQIVLKLLLLRILMFNTLVEDLE